MKKTLLIIALLGISTLLYAESPSNQQQPLVLKTPANMYSHDNASAAPKNNIPQTIYRGQIRNMGSQSDPSPPALKGGSSLLNPYPD